MARGRLHKRYKKRNPDGGGGSSAKMPGATEVLELAIPGLAGFAGSSLLTRIAAVQVTKRAPAWGKHAGAIASLGALATAWLLAHRVKALAKYQTPIVVGALIATVKSLLQLYLPRIGWIMSDPTPEMAQIASGNQVPVATGGQAALPGNLQPINDDPNLYVYDDRYDQQPPPQQQAAPQQAAQGSPKPPQSDDELLSQIADEADNQGLGIFAS